MRRLIATAVLGLGTLLLSVPARAGDDRPAPPPLAFEFRNGFWINLHHFLYEQALPKRPANKPAPLPATPLTDAQRADWERAVAYYAESIAKRDLLMDFELIAVNDRLSALGETADPRSLGIPHKLADTLALAAPVYRIAFWPEHERANRLWIAVVEPAVEMVGPGLAAQLSAAYHAPWPAKPIIVDAVEYANWAGAYTTFDSEDRVHSTIASTNPDTQGFAGVEVVFHEASHAMVHPRNGAVARAIAAAAKASGKPVPPSLWHTVIFYTTGELSRRQLGDFGVPYAPFGFHERLFSGDWKPYWTPLQTHWQAYLDGKKGFEEAIAAMVKEL